MSSVPLKIEYHNLKKGYALWIWIGASVRERDFRSLYNAHRFGNFTYSTPVVEGDKYTFTLHFAETYFTSSDSFGGIGSRIFDVYCNGRTLLKDFDILKETGGVGNRPVVKVFHNIPASAQGKLNLTFVPTKNYALVSAIEVSEE